MMPLAKDEAAALGLPGRTVTVGNRSAAAVDEALAGVVGDQQLGDRFLGAVRRLRRERRRLEHDLRQRAAVDRNRTGKHHAGPMPCRPADLEQHARAVEIHPHAEIEVGLRLAADDGREVKDRRGLRCDHPLEQRAIGDVADDLRDPPVVEAFGPDHVGQRDLVDRFVVAAGRGQLSALEQASGEGLAEEAGPAGDQDMHWPRSYRGRGPRVRGRGFAGSAMGWAMGRHTGRRAAVGRLLLTNDGSRMMLTI